MHLHYRATEQYREKKNYLYRSIVYGFFTFYIDEFSTPDERFSTQFFGDSDNSTTRFEFTGTTHTTNAIGCFLHL